MGKGNVTKSCVAPIKNAWEYKYPCLRKQEGSTGFGTNAGPCEKIQALPTAVCEVPQHLARSGRSLNGSPFRPADVGLEYFPVHQCLVFGPRHQTRIPSLLETFDRPKLTNECTNGRDLELISVWECPSAATCSPLNPVTFAKGQAIS